MHITDSGTLSRGQPGTSRAILTFPTVISLDSGTLLATYRTGTTKDSDDESVEFVRSTDGGRTWSEPWKPVENPTLDGLYGSLRVIYMTELSPGHLLGASMWIDRTTWPGGGLFNEETEGCLPMQILLADSNDDGQTWSPWQLVPMPEEIGPPSLTAPVLMLADGSLALSIETNKHYEDATPWMQRVVFMHCHSHQTASSSSGQDGKLTVDPSWEEPVVAGEDPSGRIFNWDLRVGVAPDGRIATFSWTYDTVTARYLNIHRRISTDSGRTWTDAKDLGFADQAARPAMLADGRVLLPYVDRFGSRSIRARLAPAIDAPFDPATEVVIYNQEQPPGDPTESTSETLSEMSLWTFGLPYAEALPDGTALVVYYAGTDEAMDVHWARIDPGPA
ncbi:MAG: sialidase family protein [Caldilineaceae bacterium]|nr:sialidase family protein [Caldilineaceae bacterium]